MERVCTNCHAVMGEEIQGDWCPACGGALIDRIEMAEPSPQAMPAEVDHRGIVLPRRHAVGGIITPQ